MSRMGFSTEINEKITKIHLENFPGRDKVLYLIDALEEEDAWYLYENNGLKKQSGYYIYYTRNDAMQSYMVTQRNHMVEAAKKVSKPAGAEGAADTAQKADKFFLCGKLSLDNRLSCAGNHSHK